MTCYHNKTLDTCPFCWIDAPWVYTAHMLSTPRYWRTTSGWCAGCWNGRRSHERSETADIPRRLQ